MVLIDLDLVNVEWPPMMSTANSHQRTKFFSKPSNFLYIFILSMDFENLTHWIVCSYYIIYIYKILRKSKINCYAIKEMLKFQVFVI